MAANLKRIDQHPDSDVVQLLEKTLEHARAGNVQGIIILITETGDRGYAHASGGYVRTGEALLAMESWKFSRIKMLEEKREET